MAKNSLFRLCSDVCHKSFPDRKWCKENLPYACKRELYMCREWYRSSDGICDQLKYKGMCKDGNLEGIHRTWYKNGQLEYEQEYDGGKKEGIHRAWYDSGQLEYEAEYKDGKQEGIYRMWNKNGQLIYEGEFKDGIYT